MQAITISNAELAHVFFALITLLSFAQVFGHLAEKIGIPKVIGEIFGGALLGPTGLGYLFPQAQEWIFRGFAEEGKVLAFIYWLGLVYLMFISGLEIKNAIPKKDLKIVAATILGATIIPFASGWIAPLIYDFTPHLGHKNNLLALKIIIAIAGAVTSIPVISRIFLDLGVLGSRFSNLVIAAATGQDLILWVALAIATGLVNNVNNNYSAIYSNVTITILFFTISLFLSPYLLQFLSKSRFNFLKKSSHLSYVIVVCLFFSGLAAILDVNLVFGAFLAGITLGLNKGEKFEAEKEHIKKSGVSILIPLYFSIVGLKLNLLYKFNISFFCFFFLYSSFFKMLGVLISTKLSKLNWSSSFNLSVAMNTRGGPGIILATIAYDLGIIGEAFFITLVLTSIITSLFSGLWFRWVLKNGRSLIS